MNRKVLCINYRDYVGVNNEPCSGDCYAYDDVLKIRKEERWTVEMLRTVMGRLLRAHAHICGNEHFRLGIDIDDQSGIYVGSFGHFGAQETVIGETLEQVVDRLTDGVEAYFASPQAALDIAAYPGKGRSACAYGEDAALWGWMIRASGVDLALLGGTVEAAVALLSKP